MKSFIKKAMVFLVLLSIIGFITVMSTVIYYSQTLPKISTLADYRPAIPSQIFAKDGTLLAEIGSEKREVVSFSEIPKKIVDAFLAAEDSNFFKHEGVDYLGVLRALGANIKAGRVVQGGSTITQQVAKSLLLTSERSISRKIKDFLLALQIEKRFSKEEILFLYLNQVYLGGGYYGIKTAFHGYFSKELEEVSTAEAAMVAGLLVAPGKYSPYINPEYALKRQYYVLFRMLENNMISKEEYDLALAEEIKFRIRKSSNFRAGHFTDWVRQRAIETVGEESFLKDGYKIVTTIDWELQKTAEKEIALGTEEIDKRQGFKGALKKIDIKNNEELDHYLAEYRENFYTERSGYFTLGPEKQKILEINFDHKEIEEIKEADNLWKEEGLNKRFIKGFLDKDKLYPLIEKNNKYEALVTYVDDWAQLIYVSIGGVAGIIPFEYFRWAHERVIDDSKRYFPYMRKPSQIVSAGDIIYVKIMSKQAKLLKHVSDNFANYLKKQSSFKLINDENYVLCFLDQEPDVEAALLAISPYTGEIVSMVGGTDFGKSQFNRVLQSKRQPGSSFKPLLFASALEYGFTPATIIIDSPEALGGVDESLNWKPRNYDGKFMGPITLRNALEHSRNVPTIKIADKIGVGNILNFLERIGFNAEISPDLSLSLGSFGATLEELVRAYAIFPNGGRKLELKSIISMTDRDNKIFDVSKLKKSNISPENLADNKATPEVMNGSGSGEDKQELNRKKFLENLNEKQVYDSRLAYLMANLLKGVVQHGTGKGVRDLSSFIGGKTGTTNSYVDAWFIGFSSNLVTGVWTGFDDNKTLGWGETGGKSALPIWRGFMQRGLQRYGEADLRVPLGIVNVKIDKETGELAGPSKKDLFVEAFVEGTEPGVISTERSESNTIFGEDDYYNNQ